MQRKPNILVNRLSYSIATTLVQFKELTLAFKQQRYGIVGDNGIGKTSLLKLITQAVQPEQGSVQCSGTIHYCPQYYIPHSPEESVAETLTIADDWTMMSRAQELLANFNYQQITLDRPFLSLSGGQQTLCLLVKAMLSDADFILLDEPTNNLDVAAKNKLYQWLQQSQQGLLIVSHDRILLDHMDEIIDITSKGVNRYGGNYHFYQQQKSLQQQALQQQLAEAKRQIKHAQHSIQQTHEKHAQRRKKGVLLRKNGKLDKLTANSMRGRSEKTQAKNTTQADHMLQQAETILATAKDKIEIKQSIHAKLAATHVANGKTVIAIENLHFSYAKQPPLFKNFNLSLLGSERLALCGSNGSGKTTLIKLILNELQPAKGVIVQGVNSICYLDQRIELLDPTLSLLTNFERLNPAINTRDAYFALASFNFRNQDAEKPVAQLSGGERLRAGLAISLLAKTPPQLIILDEPTNHLDLRSIETIESALNAYQGAMLVISHDQRFLDNIAIQRTICLDPLT